MSDPISARILEIAFTKAIEKATEKAIEDGFKNEASRLKHGKLLDNLISVTEMGKEYLRQEMELRKREIEVHQEEGRKVIQALYNQGGKWASFFSPADFEEICKDWQNRCQLLVLLSEPEVPSLPMEFREDLKLELRNELRDFMKKYYPLQNEQCSVRFYGQPFQRAVFDADIEKLERVLGLVPTIVLYTDVTRRKVRFNVKLIGQVISSDSALTLTCEPWQWKADIGENLEQLEKVIIQVHQLLAAFLADCYFLSINPLHEPRFFMPEVQRELSLLESNNSLVMELRNARASLLEYLRKRTIEEQVKYYLHEFAKKAKNGIPSLPYKVSSSEAESAAVRVRNFLSELPNLWSKVRSSVSNSLVRDRLPDSLPLREIRVTTSSWSETREVSGYYREEKYEYWHQLPVCAGGFNILHKDTRKEWVPPHSYTEYYYEVKISSNIAQAIDEAVKNSLPKLGGVR